jgi:uncharacterized damage-inducible protein DinB
MSGRYDFNTMRVAEAFDYLTRARRDLWQALEAAPPEALTREFLDRPELRSILDLVFHIAVVSDCWLHEDILQPPSLDPQFYPPAG